MAGIRCDVRDHAGIENALAVLRGIKSGVEIQIGSCEDQPDCVSDLLQGVQPLRQQPHVGLIDGSHGEGRQHIAVIVGHGDDLLALLMLVASVPEAISPFFATVLVPSPWRMRTSSLFSAERCPTLAMNACWSDPSSAHLAKAL